MTRKSEIQKEAANFAADNPDWFRDDIEDAFMQGAEWADNHPRTNITDVAKAYEEWNRASLKELFATAYVWLVENLPYAESLFIAKLFRDAMYKEFPHLKDNEAIKLCDYRINRDEEDL